jgi:transposase
VPRYPPDLTDAQWAVLEPRAREVMAELTTAAGRPMVHDLRAVCDAVAYVVRNGIEWRALPVDFPPWAAVYAFWDRWSARGLPQALTARLRERLRAHAGRAAAPTACIVDSQIVKSADTVPAASRGYHGGKKITGRGRHVAVDTEGWLLALVVTAASVSDKAGLKLLVIRLFDAVGTVKIMWADSGYGGAPIAAFVKTAAAITLEVVQRTSPHTFQVVRRRWVVERTLCAARRFVVFPVQPGGIRREVPGSNGLPGSERLRGQQHARKPGGRAQWSGTACRGDPRDMAKAGLPEAQSPVDASSHPPERPLKPVPCSASESKVADAPPERGATPSEGVQGDEWDAYVTLPRTTKTNAGSPAGREPQGDGGLVVVAGVTTGQGGRESRLQGEGGQVTGHHQIGRYA